MIIDEKWIREHLPEDCKNEPIDVFSGYYLDGLTVMSEGERGAEDTAVYKAESEEDSGEFDRAVLICGTGAGMSVVSNKYKGIYAVACEGIYSAKMARAINNANILCMGGWIVGPELAIEMVKTFLNTAWCQDLEDWRAENMHKFAAKVSAIEDGIYE